MEVIKWFAFFLLVLILIVIAIYWLTDRPFPMPRF